MDGGGDNNYSTCAWLLVVPPNVSLKALQGALSCIQKLLAKGGEEWSSSVINKEI